MLAGFYTAGMRPKRAPFFPTIITSIEDVTAKFMACVEKGGADDCWAWSGATDTNGYPVINLRVGRDKTQVLMARRVSLYVSGQDLPKQRIVIQRLCHSSVCLNPKHMKLSNIWAVSDKPPYVSFDELYARFSAIEKETGNDGCVIWKGSKSKPNGYGRILIRCLDGKRRFLQAHRIAYCLAHKKWPDQNLFVCHHCDTPSCVNAKHLYLGTHAQNTQDIVTRRRQHQPSTIAMRKANIKRGCNRTEAAMAARRAKKVLNDRQVAEIRERHTRRCESWHNGKPLCTCKHNTKSLSARFGVSIRQMALLCSGAASREWGKTKQRNAAIRALFNGPDGHAQCLARSKKARYKWSREMLMAHYSVCDVTIYNVLRRYPPYD